MIALWVVLGILVALLLLLALTVSKFARNKKLADLQWKNRTRQKLPDFGSVKELKITPLIDWYSSETNLDGEPGVAWLVQGDGVNLMMDVGVNLKKEDPSPLAKNMQKLNLSWPDIKYVFISHLHMDHTGGMAAQRARTFVPSAGIKDLPHVTAFVPTPMVHSTAKTVLIEKPQALLPGMASEGPIARSLWLMGLTQEQALVVNVAGKGLVLVVGCGHQGLTKIFERAEETFDQPIYGLIAGLHFPVTASRWVQMGIPMQKLMGTGKLPWQNVTKGDVRQSIAFLKSKNLHLVSISAHDSCDWSIQQFKDAFKDSYVDLKVGQAIVVNGDGKRN
jgi:7,8-dihydropterin-6-yl-methyl-4-(beta-D-ribofuranosyl)aminobenzene 5'-phosphate synthase